MGRADTPVRMGWEPLSEVGSCLEAVQAVRRLGEIPSHPERIAALERVVTFARTRGDRETALALRGLLDGYGRVIQGQEAIGPLEARLGRLGENWRKAEWPTPVASLPKPLFEAGGVRFFKTDAARMPESELDEFRAHRQRQIRGEPLPDLYGPRSIPFDRPWLRWEDFLPAVLKIGGVVAGDGSLELLDLALAAEAAGVVFIGRDPMVPMTLTLLLAQLTSHRSVGTFVEAARRWDSNWWFSHRGEGQRLVDLIPPTARPPFDAHIVRARRQRGDVWRQVERLRQRQGSFLNDPGRYDQVRALAMQGRIAVLYGDPYGAETPDLLQAAVVPMGQPVRVLSLGDPLHAVDPKDPAPATNMLLQILNGPVLDREGRFLAVTRHTPRSFDRPWDYHGRPLWALSNLISLYGDLRTVLERFGYGPKVVPPDAPSW